MVEENPTPGGFFANLRQLGATALALVFTRLELASLEWQEERARATSILLWSAVFLCMAFMALVALTLLLVVAFQQQALWVLIGFSVFYVAGALIALSLIIRRMKAPLFHETINQMKKDREWLLGPKG